MVELISPAGDWAMLEAAKKAGANAIYFGLKEFNMRHSAKNFSIQDLKKIGKLEIKKYLTLNTIVYDKEIKTLKKIIEKAYINNIDAIICWDIAVLEIAKEIGIDIHLSTQASIANSNAANFYKELGIKRIVLARELNLKQIRKIKENTNMEIECFIHGALCTSISGRCFLSQELYNKSANRGRCLQPCRREFKIIGDDNKELTLGNNYILSSKDLCTLPFIDRLIKNKIDAFKIEGRTRNPEYIKVSTECYRKAIDAYSNNEFNPNLVNELIKKLKTVYNRKFSNGFYLALPTSSDFTDISGSATTKKKIEIGRILNYYKNKEVAIIKLFRPLKIKDKLLIIGDKTGVIEQEINSMQIDYKDIDKVKEGLVAIKMNNKVREGDRVYRYE